MRLSYNYGTEIIEFEVIFRSRKTLSIEVEAPRRITVISPEGKSEDEILETVKTKSKWIVQTLFEIREMEYRKRDKQYVNGESFIYMGRNYSLQIVLDEKASFPEAKLSRGKFFSPVLDYIVVNEMCHMVHMNHSKEFWHLLKRVLPDYEQRKSWLRDNGIKYDL